jgi:hypothetical protein
MTYRFVIDGSPDLEAVISTHPLSTVRPVTDRTPEAFTLEVIPLLAVLVNENPV